MRVTTTHLNTTGTTTDEIRVVENNQLPAGFRPEFVRLPKVATLCPWTGLSRSGMWELVASGNVRSVSLRKKGSKKGTRLVELASLLDYLHGKLEVIAKG